MSLQNLFVQDSGKSAQDVYCDELVCNSLNVAGGKQQFAGTASGIWASSQAVTIDYEVVGSQCIISLSLVGALANAAGVITISGIPAAIRPAVSRTLWMPSTDNGAQVSGSATVTSGGDITIFAGPLGTAFSGAGVSGFNETSLAYLL